MTHTPGPWTQSRIPGRAFQIAGPDGDPLLRINGGMMPTVHDARLITAAPKLLAALEGFVAAVQDTELFKHELTEGLAAIFEAEGLGERP